MKKAISYFLTILLLSGCLCFGAVSAAAAGVGDHIRVTSYDPGVDYMQAIKSALKDGSPYALQVGAIYEKQRNFKIDALKLNVKKTSYFATYRTAEEILKAIEAAERPAYTPAELDLLARIIYAEAGCSWIPDWVQQMVGSVVLNRVNSAYYPNTIREVVYQPGQYSPTWDGSIEKTPDARTVANARYLLENGSICPGNVVGQNSIITGSGVYREYYDTVLGTTVYFCYL